MENQFPETSWPFTNCASPWAAVLKRQGRKADSPVSVSFSARARNWGVEKEKDWCVADCSAIRTSSSGAHTGRFRSNTASRRLKMEVFIPIPIASDSTAVAVNTGLLCKSLNAWRRSRSEEHTSELQSLRHLVCRLL